MTMLRNTIHHPTKKRSTEMVFKKKSCTNDIQTDKCEQDAKDFSDEGLASLRDIDMIGSHQGLSLAFSLAEKGKREGYFHQLAIGAKTKVSIDVASSLPDRGVWGKEEQWLGAELFCGCSLANLVDNARDDTTTWVLACPA